MDDDDVLLLLLLLLLEDGCFAFFRPCLLLDLDLEEEEDVAVVVDGCGNDILLKAGAD